MRLLRAALGGWRGMGGLVAATCAGFWIGVALPLGLTGAGAAGADTFDLSQAYAADGFSAFGWDMEEQ